MTCESNNNCKFLIIANMNLRSVTLDAEVRMYIGWKISSNKPFSILKTNICSQTIWFFSGSMEIDGNNCSNKI